MENISSVGSSGMVPFSSTPPSKITFCWIFGSRRQALILASVFSSWVLIVICCCAIMLSDSFVIAVMAPSGITFGFAVLVRSIGLLGCFSGNSNNFESLSHPTVSGCWRTPIWGLEISFGAWWHAHRNSSTCSKGAPRFLRISSGSASSPC